MNTIKITIHTKGDPDLKQSGSVEETLVSSLTPLGYERVQGKYEHDKTSLVFVQTKKPDVFTVYFFYDLKGNKQGSLNYYKMTQMSQGQPVQWSEVASLDAFDGFLHNEEWLG